MSSSQLQGMERRVVPFAIPADRIRARQEASDDHGVILPFTGVRYERPPAPAVSERTLPREPHVRT